MRTPAPKLVYAFAAVLLCLAGCARYTGDGRLVDNGVLNYASRYELDLGPVDLTRLGQQCFNLSGLPRAEFNAGLDIVESEGFAVSGPMPDHAVSAHLKLTTELGEMVIDETGPISTWTRQTPAGSPLTGRLYIRGQRVDNPLPNGDVRVERIGELAHGGWGSYFKAERGARYSLCLSVLSTDLPRPIPARLRLVGW
jgi:hypothetical protein